ncbi:hypothetical protein CHS0354_017216 [Potamilus streckersoni]|uniref:Mpv17-like protein n=1 Tax=Potamilus streckersoni TaxID=2493646 RepID=A0AAE0VL93_9BIVA|nr:hypothetical protein CHS0354_017216 [Potamilus streckersoni]
MMQSVLKKRPLMRTMIAYGFVNVTADALEQNLISKKKVYDSLKTVRVTLVGTFLVAPLVFNWIRLTERLLPSKKVPAVLIKVLCDQFLFAPVAITTFYIGTNILERQKDLLAEWKRKFFPTWTTGMMFWPIAQAINFRFIPWELKTIYLPCCSLIWTTYLCYMKEK